MLYTNEKKSLRGKVWQLPNKYWRACNLSGEQCTFKLWNEAKSFAEKGKNYLIKETIRKKGSQWCVYPKGGGDSLGCHDTKKEAQDQLAAIEANKSEGIVKEARKMTRNQVWQQFKTDILPHIKKTYERDGIPDKPARREAWNNYVDSLAQDGLVSYDDADNWSHPRGLETESIKEASRETILPHGQSAKLVSKAQEILQKAGKWNDPQVKYASYEDQVRMAKEIDPTLKEAEITGANRRPGEVWKDPKHGWSAKRRKDGNVMINFPNRKAAKKWAEGKWEYAAMQGPKTFDPKGGGYYTGD